MKISIITCVYNNVATIERALRSVVYQDYPQIEYIVLDGGSTDGSQKIIEKYKEHIAVYRSEKDGGLYPAINKGISLSSGDYVGLVHADDFLWSPQTITQIVSAIASESVQPEVISGNVVFFRTAPQGLRITRKYSSSGFQMWHFRFGIMPAHTASFVQRAAYEQWGNYRSDFVIAADFEFFVRIHRKVRNWLFIPQEVVAMEMGGISTQNSRSNLIISQEIIRLLQLHNLKTHWLLFIPKYALKALRLIPFRMFHWYVTDWTSKA